MSMFYAYAMKILMRCHGATLHAPVYADDGAFRRCAMSAPRDGFAYAFCVAE